MDRPRVRQVPEGSGEQGTKEETGREIICGASTTLAVQGQMMMMMTDKQTVKIQIDKAVMYRRPPWSVQWLESQHKQTDR